MITQRAHIEMPSGTFLTMAAQLLVHDLVITQSRAVGFALALVAASGSALAGVR
jgi:hypothetical protein